MKEMFDKEKFDKKNDRMMLVYLITGAIGALSIICAFAIGNGI